MTMNYFTCLLSIGLLSTVLSPCASSAESERLLPDAVKDSFPVTYKVDGAAVYFYLKNNSNYVLTAGEIHCTVKDPKGNIGLWSFPSCGPKGCSWDTSTATIKDKLLPGKEAEIYVESNASGKLLSCFLTRSRGREPKFYETWDKQ